MFPKACTTSLSTLTLKVTCAKCDNERNELLSNEIASKLPSMSTNAREEFKICSVVKKKHKILKFNLNKLTTNFYGAWLCIYCLHLQGIKGEAATRGSFIIFSAHVVLRIL